MENQVPQDEPKNPELKDESSKPRQIPKNEELQNINNPPLEKKNEEIEAEPEEKLILKFGQTPLLINRLDYYANAIPLGAICNAISFILYGFYEAKVLKEFNSLQILLIFGGIGQVVTGVLEYIKGRSFICTLYMTYGLYFISFFCIRNLMDDNNTLKVFYGSWAGLSFPLIISSVKSNLFYLIQTVAIFVFFVLRCVGECRNIAALKEKVSGSLEIIGGILSFYIAVSQVINEHFRSQIVPCVPLQQHNGIDIMFKKNDEN